jgi:acyl dehydratase
MRGTSLRSNWAKSAGTRTTSSASRWWSGPTRDRGAVKVVDESEITSFARLFDPQPFHLDREAATNSRFGGLVASGWHTGAMTMRLLVDSEFRIAGGKCWTPMR